jgi:hypothetical protein
VDPKPSQDFCLHFLDILDTILSSIVLHEAAEKRAPVGVTNTAQQLKHSLTRGDAGAEHADFQYFGASFPKEVEANHPLQHPT